MAADTASSFSFSCFFHAHATQPPSGATRCSLLFLFLIFNISLEYTRVSHVILQPPRRSLPIVTYIYILYYYVYTRGGGGKEFLFETPEVQCECECVPIRTQQYIRHIIRKISCNIYYTHDDNNLVIICLCPYMISCIL